MRAVFKHGVHFLLKSLEVDRQLGVLFKGPFAASEDYAEPEVLHRDASLGLPLPLLRVVLAVGHLTQHRKQVFLLILLRLLRLLPCKTPKDLVRFSVHLVNPEPVYLCGRVETGRRSEPGGLVDALLFFLRLFEVL